MEALSIEDAFWEIGRERLIKDRKTRELRAKLEEIQELITDTEEPHDARIAELKEFIAEHVLEGQASEKSDFGSCSFVKGRKGSEKWDGAALTGYAEAGHPELYQFRTEGEPGKPTVRWNLPKIEDLRKDLELEELRREKAAREAKEAEQGAL
jgi:hypothetical protein